MKQVYLDDRGVYTVREVSPPTLQSQGALVRTVVSFIGSGSETGDTLRRRRNPGDGSQAWPMSYQSCGRIVEVSPGLEGYRVGDLVACTGMGYALHAEMSAIPRLMMTRVPEGVAPEAAAANNLGLTAMHALRRGRFLLGETVAVIGLGLVGQLTAQLVRASGGVALGTDLVESRLRLARETGTQLALNPRETDVVQAALDATDGRGADLAVVCAAAPDSPEPLRQACALVRDRGRVVIVGMVKIDVPFGALRTKEIDLLISRGRGPGQGDAGYEREGVDYPLGYVRWTENRNLEAYLRLLAEGKLRIDPLITHRIPIERAPEGYEAILTDPSGTLGVVLTYGEG